jgi:hypothetical protein
MIAFLRDHFRREPCPYTIRMVNRRYWSFATPRAGTFALA